MVVATALKLSGKRIQLSTVVMCLFFFFAAWSVGGESSLQPPLGTAWVSHRLLGVN